jgi:hypothetical protein
MSRRGDFGLSTEEAQAEIERIATVTATWRQVFKNVGVDNATIERIAPAFSIADSFSRQDHPEP